MWTCLFERHAEITAVFFNVHRIFKKNFGACFIILNGLHLLYSSLQIASLKTLWTCRSLSAIKPQKRYTIVERWPFVSLLIYIQKHRRIPVCVWIWTHHFNLLRNGLNQPWNFSKMTKIGPWICPKVPCVQIWQKYSERKCSKWPIKTCQSPCCEMV